MSFINANDPFSDMWVIHTHRPNYRIYANELDEDFVDLKTALKEGIEVLEKHPLARGMLRPRRAAESLEYSRERAEIILWARADENGDFYTKDGELARELWDKVKNDPEPKPTLDPKSPPLPKVEKEEVKEEPKPPTMETGMKLPNLNRKA